MKIDKVFFVRSAIFYLLLSGSFLLYAQHSIRPDGFLEIQREIPSVILDIRYAGTHNFIGKPIDGYQEPIAILSEEAVLRLKKVQTELKTLGLGLKIFDAYRPQRAVDHFVQWANDETDTLMKAEFYPDVAKNNLFRLGYIAGKSGHTRGSTIDLTLVDLQTGKELNMGSAYDFFGKISWPFDSGITAKQHTNRLLLRNIMLANGFKPYAYEWWHFTLEEEPFPRTYFNFPVK